MRRAAAIVVIWAGVLSAAAALAQAPQSPDVIWRVDIKTVPPNTFGRHRLAFSPDSSLVGVVYQPRDARILRASDGALVRELTAASQSAYSIAFSPNGLVAVGRGAVAAGQDAAVELIELATWRSESFPCRCSLVHAIAFSPDARLLAMQGITSPRDPESTYVLELASGATVATLDAFSNRSAVSFSPDGARFAASAFGDAGTALGFRVWNAADWQLTTTYSGEPRVAFGEMGTGLVGGQWVAIYGREGAIEMRSLDDDRVVWTKPLLPRRHDVPDVIGSELDRVAIAPNGRFLVSYESPVAVNPNSHVAGFIVLRDTSDGSVTAVHDVNGVTDISIAPNSGSFVYATGAGAVHIARFRVAN